MSINLPGTALLSVICRQLGGGLLDICFGINYLTRSGGLLFLVTSEPFWSDVIPLRLAPAFMLGITSVNLQQKIIIIDYITLPSKLFEWRNGFHVNTLIRALSVVSKANPYELTYNVHMYILYVHCLCPCGSLSEHSTLMLAFPT